MNTMQYKFLLYNTRDVTTKHFLFVFRIATVALLLPNGLLLQINICLINHVG